MDNTPKYKRRIAAILSADVVGYSRLISRNDELTVTVLHSCREIVHQIVSKHTGRVFGTAGDSFMAEFASSVEALQCALEIQSALGQRNKDLPENEQMWLRTGITSGIVIEDDHSVLYGESVNVAAELPENRVRVVV